MLLAGDGGGYRVAPARASEASAITEEKRQAATTALNTYSQKVQSHQRSWAEQHAGKYHTAQEAEAEWRKAWETDGVEARNEAAPYIAAFEEAVRNELRVAAENAPGGDLARAVDQKVNEIKGRDSAGSADTTLDALTDQAAAPIRTESTDARHAAIDVFDKTNALDGAEADLADIDRRIAGAQDESTFTDLQTQQWEAQKRLTGAEQAVLDAIGRELNIRIADQVVADAENSVHSLQDMPGVNQFELREARQYLSDAHAQRESVIAGGTPAEFTDAQLSAAKTATQAGHSSDLHGAIEYAGAKARIGQELDRVEALPAGDGTDPTSRLAKDDPVTLAFLREAGVELDPNDPKLTEQERKLMQDDPFIFGLLQLGGAKISQTEVGTPTVTIGGKDVTLTQEQRELYEQGNMQGFAMSLLPQVQLAPNTQLLMAATSGVRHDFVVDHMRELMGGSEKHPTEALEFLATNLNASFSLEDRQQLWQDAGAQYFTKDFFHNEFSKYLQRPDPSSDNPDDIRLLNDSRTHMDQIGREVLQPYADVAPPEVANVILDTVKADFGEDWYKSFGTSSGLPGTGTEFYKGLSRLVESSPDRADEFARWISDGNGPAGDLVYTLRGSDMGYGFDGVRQTISDGKGWALSDALLSRVKTDDNLSNFAPDLDLRVTQGKGDAQEDLVKTILRDDYAQFNRDPMRTVQPYFDQFKGDPHIGHEVTPQTDTELRNIIGRTLGLTPANEAAALAGDYSVEWYGDDTNARKQIDLVMGWIKKEGGDRPTLTALPMIYAAESAGVQEGALFKVDKHGGGEAVIDGSVADDVIAMDDDHNVSPDDGTDLPWKYDSVDNFLDDNKYDTGGYIWLPKDYAINDLDHDDHVDVQRMEAARVTGGERFKFYADIGIGVLATVGGIALAIPTGGTSLAAAGGVWAGIATAAVWTGVGWGAYRSMDELADMHSHGQTLSPANAQARAAYIGLAGTAFGAGALSAGARATTLAARGTQLSQEAVIGLDTAMLQQGANALSSSQRFGQFSRVTGYGAFGIGVEQTGEQSINLAVNWTEMSAEERAQSLMYLGLGVADMGTGIWAHRRFGPQIAETQRQQHQDAAFQTQQAMHAVSLIEKGLPLPESLGSYVHLDAGTIRYVPKSGDPVTIHLDRSSGGEIVVPGRPPADAPTPTIDDLFIPGQTRDAPPAALWTPDQTDTAPGYYYTADGQRRYYQQTRELPTRPVSDADNFWPRPRGADEPPRKTTVIELIADKAGEIFVRRQTYSEETYQQFWDQATGQQRAMIGVPPGGFKPDEMTLRLAQVPGGLETLVADIHAHNRSYGREEGGEYMVALLNMAGGHSRILFGSIPQFCGGDAHYSNNNPSPGTMRDAWMLDRDAVQEFYRIFARDPALAAKGDLSITSLDFSDHGGMDVVGYGRGLMLEHPGLFPFIGEVTGGKELVSVQMGPFAWDTNSQRFQDYLRFANETGQGVLLHYDWGDHHLTEGGKPQAAKQAYENFDKLVDLLSRPEYRDVNIVLAHTGIGRFVRPDSEVTPFQRPNGQTVMMPEHIQRLYKLFEAVPNARADISWNDVTQAYADHPELREGLISFVVDNQDRLLFGSDTVKPGNSGMYHQALNTGSPLFAEVARRDPMAAWKLLRGNYEAVMTDATSRVADWTRQQPDVTPEQIARMDATLDILSQHRLRMEQGAWQDFQTWLGMLNGSPNGAQAVNADPGVFPRLYDSLPGPEAQGWRDGVVSQTGRGTAGGYAQEHPFQRSAPGLILVGEGSAAFLAATRDPGTSRFIDPNAPGSSADLINAGAFEGRAILIGLQSLYRTHMRREHEAIFEHGHVTRQSLDDYVSRIMAGKTALGLTQEQQLRIGGATEQFWANYQYLRDLPIDDARGWTETQRYNAIMAKTGEYLITLDRELGVQTSSIDALDARRGLGQAVRGGTLLTYLVNDAATMQWLTSGDIDLSTPAGQSEAAFRLLFGLGNGALTAHTAASLGGGLSGVTLDSSPSMRFIQTAGLSGIAAGGGFWTVSDAMRLYGELSSGSPGGTAAATASVLLDAAFTWYTAKAAANGWKGLTGGPMPSAGAATVPMIMLAGSLALRELIALGEGVFGGDDQSVRAEANTGPWREADDLPFPIPRDISEANLAAAFSPFG